MEREELTEREHQVLDAVVRNFILSAAPTGSRYISKLKGFDLSPASIRNVMYDLEDRGFITQPHTSAGRIPTDKGYRYYVDWIMKYTEISDDTKDMIRSSMVAVDQSDLHLLLEAATRALSRATNQLGVVLAPRLSKGILKQLNLFHVDANRYVLNVALESGFVKTVVVEFETEVPQDRLELACRIISTKFAGKALEEITVDDEKVFRDVPDLELGIIRLLVPSIRKLLQKDETEEVFADGETNVMLQPEFFNRENVGAVIEILEEKKMLVHLFETPEVQGRVVISIGEENRQDQLQSFSIIKTGYRVGGMVGSLGVIGPKRMPYPFLVSAVEYTAKVLGELHS
ncbi:MAG TPA: heat-inducible transcriptional repressor HrcA [Chitinispirillaceae bacterium]|nr:heat-inducible transcriptional repressor HrcA [Chitinispirillaceae bacterium]